MVSFTDQNGKLLSMNNTKKENILILFGADSKLEWGRSYQLARAFIKLGHQVLYIDLPSSVSNSFGKNKFTGRDLSELSIFRPRFGLPYGRFPVLRSLNRINILAQVISCLKDEQFVPDIIWVYSPYEPNIVVELKKIYKPYRVVYDCADERVSYAEMNGGERAASLVRKFEFEIIKQCDIVFTITDNLKILKSTLSSNIHVIPNGIDLCMFNDKIEYSKPSIYDRMQGKIVLYIGSVEKWVDLKLIQQCANTLKDVSFVFVGPCNVDVSSIKCMSNVYFTGKVPYSDVPAYIKHSDVCIIPFISDGMITYSNTLKSLQYLSIGKPVISTYYDGVNDYCGLVSIVDGYSEFIEKLDLMLSKRLKVVFPDLNRIIDNYSWDRIASRALSEIYTISEN